MSGSSAGRPQAPGGPQGSWATSRRDTGPELAVRRLLHASGLRYRVDVAPLPGLRRRRADIVFTARLVAVFIDGCFWHGCPEHWRLARQNTDYWGAKVQRNRDRDAETSDRLRDAGWTVLRFWEHEDPAAVADTITAVVVNAAALRPSAAPERLQRRPGAST